MGIENLLRYKLRKLPETRKFSERYGFYCPVTNRIWVSSSPVDLVKLNRYVVWGCNMGGNWFERPANSTFWEPFPFVKIDDNLLWE